MAENNAILRKIVLPERGVETLFGPYDENIKTLEELLSVRVTVRGSDIVVEGGEADVDTVQRIIEDYGALVAKGSKISNAELKSAFKQIAEDRAYSLQEHMTSARINPTGKKQVTARSVNQRRYLESIEQNDVVFGVGVAGTGKCVAEGSLVLTDRGLVEIGSLTTGGDAGDYEPITLGVHGLGGPEAASHVYVGGESDTLRVTTRFGYSIEATPEHPLMVMRPDGHLAWCRADELRVGDVLAMQRGQRMFGTSTEVDFTYRPRTNRPDCSRPVQLDAIDEEFGYFLGVLTGDGCLTCRNRIILSSADESIVAAFHAISERLGLHVFRNGDRAYDYVIASSQLYQLLEQLGMSTGPARTKRVPRAVRTAPEPIVAAYLRGLFDSDGSADRRDGTVTLNSVSEPLVSQVQVILLNFGVVASRSLKRGRYRGAPHVSHLLTISGEEAERFHETIGFGLDRKRERRLDRPSNPNVDVVPFLGPSLTAAVQTTTLTRADHQLFADYRRGRRRPSYAKLEAFIRILDARRAFGLRLEHMRRLAELRLLFLPVVGIEVSRARVFDLTVPKTHSFVANGFVNHNTFLAVAMAIQALWSKRVNRIILTRPAVEAGEKLGFLPGDLQEKVDPYLRPLYDALFDLADFERITKLLEKRVIEIAPLAFMRGRAQPLDSRVLTPSGWRTMGSLEPGDEVIGSDGRATEVLGVYPQGEKLVYRVTTSDGASTLACAEHLWAVRTPEDKRDGKVPRVLETQEMIDNLRRFHQHRYELPVLSEPVDWPHREVPLDAYALGLLLGDGCITGKTTPSFATTDTELVSSLGAAFGGIGVTLRHKGGVDYTLPSPAAGHGGAIVRNPLTEALRGLDLLGTRSSTKFVPDAYLFNSADVRLAVLQGLLDTDGGPVRQAGRSSRIQYSTSSPRLKDNVLFLVRSLGGVAYWRLRRAEGRKPGRAKGRDVPHHTDTYVLNIRLPRGVEPFRLARKAAIYREHGGGRPLRYVTSIEPAGVQATQCILVDAPDSLYVTDDFIVTHNTLGDAFIILDEAQNTTTEQMKMFLTRIGIGSKAVITGDVTQIDLPAGRRSGLVEAERVLKGIDGIEFTYFTERDVVRHKLVQMIIRAYDEHSRKGYEGAT